MFYLKIEISIIFKLTTPSRSKENSEKKTSELLILLLEILLSFYCAKITSTKGIELHSNIIHVGVDQ